MRSVPLLEAGVIHVGQSDREAAIAHHRAAPVRTATNRLAWIDWHHMIDRAIARFRFLDLHLLAVQIDEVVGGGTIDSRIGIKLIVEIKALMVMAKNL